MILKLKDKELKVKYDAAAVYRFSKLGGNVEEIKNIVGGDRERAGRAFFNAVAMAWAMLAEDSRDEYREPEDLAPLMLPLPPKSFFDGLASVIKEGTAAMGLNEKPAKK